MRAWFLRAAGVLAALGISYSAEPLPAAPAGFSWSRLKEIRADILKPAGWTLSRQRKGDSETYRLTGAPGGESGGPALDINWVADIPGKAKMKPSAYAAGLVSAAADAHKLLDKSSGSQGPFTTASFRFQDSGPGRDGIMVRYQFFANDRTGSLYIMAFEAPANKWANSWKTGQLLVDRVRLDPGL